MLSFFHVANRDSWVSAFGVSFWARSTPLVLEFAGSKSGRRLPVSSWSGRSPLWKFRSTGNDHEPWTNLGSSSDDARRSVAAHCSGRQAPLRLLHGAPACHHSWCSLLGAEGIQSAPTWVGMGLCSRGASLEPILADSDATRTVAVNRPLAGHSLNRMVWILAIPQADAGVTAANTD